MKNKRILLIIGCILIAGVLITRYTSSFITRQEIQSAAITGAVNAGAEAALADVPEDQGAAAPGPGRSEETDATPGELPGTLAAAAGRAAPGGMEAEGAAPQAGPGAVPETDAAPAAAPRDAAEDGGAAAYEETSSGPVSPIEGINGKNSQSYMTQSNDYRQRLVDLDNQIQKLREGDKDATAYTLKDTAESELKLWEGEMGNIYSALMEQMPKKEAEELAAEQQEWLKDREARAAEQNSKSSAANLESVGYITSLVSITRARAYELVGRYEELTTGDSGT